MLKNLSIKEWVEHYIISVKFKIIVALAYFALGLPLYAQAVSCEGGCGQLVNFNVNETLSANENIIGKIISSNSINISPYSYRFGPSVGQLWQTIDYASDPDFVTDTYKYFRVDDYVSLGVSLNDFLCGRIYYAPTSFVSLTEAPGCAPATISANAYGTLPVRSFSTQLYIKKKMIGGSYVINRKVLTYYIGESKNAKQAHIADVYFYGVITVPEACELNAAQVINIDFGNISSGAFKTAGAIAQGVQPQSRSISVKCDNVAGNAQLQMRLQADQGKVAGQNIVVADENKDVGFRVTNNSGTPLRVNDITSYIPFTLDNNARQSVTIQVYPVSVTGNKPTEGAVTSRAYLRVDFP